LPPIPLVDRTGPLALSFAQQRLWFLTQFGEAVSAAYHLTLGVRMRGRLDRRALQRALDAIVARHEALRATFTTLDGEAIQKIAPVDVGFALEEDDLVDALDKDDALRALAEREAATAFDLERGPLIRGRLARLDAEDHALLLTMHHIVSDGWSMGVLTSELSTLYGAFCRGETGPLPALPVQYADYAAWQRQWLNGERLQR
ncbi:condensation domain-containing protein, partial [Methylosinus sp. Sm6]|uniref:condensation domain-containing protein n=1 Tax=Methylosinus sp. Sm6 TaxID=2866948 RepID=UPI001C9A22DF